MRHTDTMPVGRRRRGRGGAGGGGRGGAGGAGPAGATVEDAPGDVFEAEEVRPRRVAGGPPRELNFDEK